MFLSYGIKLNFKKKNKISNTQLYDVLSGLIRDQTFCKIYQQTTIIPISGQIIENLPVDFRLIVKYLRKIYRLLNLYLLYGQ